MQKRVTITEIAKLSGSSPAAVSRVLSGKAHRYSEATVAKIRKVADAHGYRPNPYAKSLRSGRFHAVTVLLGRRNANSFFPHKLRMGIADALMADDTQSQLMFLNEDRIDEKPERLDDMARTWITDGFLVNFQAEIPAWLTDFLERQHLPHVFLNRKQPRNAVYLDDEANGYNATRHLLEAGHRNITFLYNSNSHTQHYSAEDRKKGHTKAMQEAGLTPTWEGVPIGRSRESVLQMMDLLRRPDRPTALISGGQEFVAWAMVAAYRLGWDLPRDLSVVCIDSLVRDHVGLVPDNVSLNFEGLGNAAANMLLEQIQTGRYESESQVISSPVLRKYTLAPPPLSS